jgi:ribonuclease P protein component
VGISVSSKLGNAVVRNRIKRQVRMICDELLCYTQPVDIVIVVRKNYLDHSFEDNKESFKQFLVK